eukprot:990193_1
MANTFSSIFALPSSCNILKIDYGRDEFNLLLRLLCVQQNQYDDEEVIASVVDYKQNIVKLPHLHIPSDFIHYLSIKQQQLSLSSATQLSNQYALGPPSNDAALMEETEEEEEEMKSDLINLCSLPADDGILSHLFNFYSSQYAHTFIEEGNDYNYIPQEATAVTAVCGWIE